MVDLSQQQQHERGEQKRHSVSDTVHAGSSAQAAYPPAISSMAFPDDPFSAPRRTQANASAFHPVSPGGPATPDSLSEWAKATRFTVLNHFSQVTNAARYGAHTLLSMPLISSAPSTSDRTSTASVGTSLLHHGPIGPFGPHDPDWKHSELAQKSGTGDFDSAHVYLARWARIVAEEGEANRKREARGKKSPRAHMTTATASTSAAAVSHDDVEESDLGNFEVWNRFPYIDRPEPTRARNHPLTITAWRSLFDEEGRPTVSRAEMKTLVFQQGFGTGKERMVGTHWDQLDPRAECWSFLLDAQEWNVNVTRDDRRQRWNSRAEEYWSIKTQYLARMQPPPPPISKQANGLVAAEGDSAAPAVLSEEALQMQLDETAFWKEQRHRVHVDCLRVDRKLPFFREQDDAAISTFGGGEDDRESYTNTSVNAHAQRLEEILLTYVAWDRANEEEAQGTPDGERGQLGGYVQGMSDLCAPLYVVSHGDEAKTFWLLVGLMRRARSNFYANQSGMKQQLLQLQKLISLLDATLHAHLERTESLNLFFCFRWLLVWFKREFDFPDILLLWEAMFAAELDQDSTSSSTAVPLPPPGLSNHFAVFVAMSILEQQRDVVVKYLTHFDEMLQYMNGLSGQLDVDRTLAEAQGLCLTLRQLIEQQQRQKDLKANLDPTSGAAMTSMPPIDPELFDLVGLTAADAV